MEKRNNFLAFGGYPFSEFGGYIKDMRESNTGLSQAVLPDDGRFDVDCHLNMNTKLKMPAARDVYNNAELAVKEEICSKRCGLKCFIN